MSDKVSGQPAKSERRRHARMAVHWSGDLSDGGEAVDCTVLDISPGGAKLQSSNPLPQRTAVWLKLYHGGEFNGQVAWQRGSFMGIEFAPQTAAA